MSDEELLLKKRFLELARKSDGGGYFTFTDFLGLAEQSVFLSLGKELWGFSYTRFGGAPGTERVMIRFGNEEALGYAEPFPITVLHAVPRAPKFAEKLTHRDFLGALLNLGIERHTLGDIAVRESDAYIFAREDIAEYIASSLTRVRKTEMTITMADAAELQDIDLFRTERVNIQLSGERLDAAVAKVFSLSRDDAQALFRRGLVFASGKEIESVSYVPKPDEVISVRGFGRFIYRGPFGTSKKGKLNVAVDKYV